MLPIARGLAEAGHQILVATSSYLVAVFDGEPVEVQVTMPDLGEIILNIREYSAEHNGGAPDERLDMIAFGGGEHVTAAFEKTIPIAREFAPDLVLRDGSELAGALISEALDVPLLSVPSGAGNTLDPDGLLELLNRRRAEVGLPESADRNAIYRNGRIDCMPHRYSFADYAPPQAFAYRQPLDIKRNLALPDEVARLSGDKPLVIASIGTTLGMVKTIREQGVEADEHSPEAATPLAAIVRGLSEVDCHAVVATGGYPVEVPVGDNVHLYDWIPQPLLLQCAQAFLTHCGYNSTREAVGAGVPMAGLPLMGDQEYHADRAERMSLGRKVPEESGEAIAETVTALLADTQVRAEMRRAHREMLALPGVDGVVEHLEHVVAAST
ncbi:glycosyltransferase [Sciscionella marina]|uniref:glycosyltransferase n=1 Tax=Sciscionella marina TaxID=508770 RepID=UPI0003636893|nr:glycosyltransferase [Sciscionella marina]